MCPKVWAVSFCPSTDSFTATLKLVDVFLFPKGIWSERLTIPWSQSAQHNISIVFCRYRHDRHDSALRSLWMEWVFSMILPHTTSCDVHFQEYYFKKVGPAWYIIYFVVFKSCSPITPIPISLPYKSNFYCYMLMVCSQFWGTQLTGNTLITLASILARFSQSYEDTTLFVEGFFLKYSS